MVLGALAGLNSWTSTSTPLKIRLTITQPTATVPGTELPNGGGYTTGGLTITFGGLVGTATGAVCYNTGSLSWTNSGVASWVLLGLELWDAAPTRKAFGLLDDQPLTISPGSPLTFAAQSIGWAFP